MSLLRTVFSCVLVSCCLMGAANAAPRFVDARDYPASGAGARAFDQMESSLIQGFNHVCGDTFCEGEYINYLPLRLTCSVRLDNGVLKSCHWALVGSDTRIDQGRGALRAQLTSSICGIPLAGGTLLSTLLASVEGGDNLHKPLPGTRRSVYDAISDCLSQRAGSG